MDSKYDPPPAAQCQFKLTPWDENSKNTHITLVRHQKVLGKPYPKIKKESTVTNYDPVPITLNDPPSIREFEARINKSSPKTPWLGTPPPNFEPMYLQIKHEQYPNLGYNIIWKNKKVTMLRIGCLIS